MRLWIKYADIILRSQMQYKVSFALTALGQFLVSFSMFAGVYFMFLRFNSVEGYSFSEVLICFASVLMSYSLAECFFRGFDGFAGIISQGEFDRIMVRPRSPMMQVLCSRVEFSRIGRLLQAVAVMIYAVPSSGIHWSADKILTLVLMIIGGIFLFAGLFIIYASICFFTIEGLEFMNIFTDGGREFGRYPLAIYGEAILKFFTYIIPLALVQYYPLLYLLGRTENKLTMLLPLAGILFLLPSYAFWRLGVKHYKSSGS